MIDDHLLRLDESLHGDALLMEAAELIMEAAQLIASMDGDSEFFERVYNAVYPDARGL